MAELLREAMSAEDRRLRRPSRFDCDIKIAKKCYRSTKILVERWRGRFVDCFGKHRSYDCDGFREHSHSLERNHVLASHTHRILFS